MQPNRNFCVLEIQKQKDSQNLRVLSYTAPNCPKPGRGGEKKPN